MLVYNTNAGLGKAGFYYNAGTPASPSWSPVGEGGSLTLPFSQIATNSGPLFLINNTDANAASVAISGLGGSAIGIRGATLSGKGVVGHAGATGTGVFASVADTDGKALEVSGPMKIAGPGQSPGNGKVLMSDGSGNATWENISGNVTFRASGIQGDGNEVIADDGPPVKVAFAGENYDFGNNYNDMNASPHSTFTAPKNGVYHFDVQVLFHNSVTDQDEDVTYNHSLMLVLTRNGNSVIVAESRHTGIYYSPSIISTDLQLQASDQIHIAAKLYTPFGFNQPGTLGLSFIDSFFSGTLIFEQ
ncbi:hypothetical protein [Dyadobacter chenhuakuii]|uniref:C1q domain-containing protein n=1 Tax=Dyadobacter chenhuakuii TaxID=2909339 RepID=A0A9X1U3D3_9BACT|nr:hypothetical protein [Dyadobacter chenhuakuii]MCF2501401.1 hypothetical protein [Dyadobacter chenhuakuii]